MKDEMKRLLKDAVIGLQTCGELDKRQIWVERLIRNIPSLLTDITFLEIENRRLQAKVEELEKINEDDLSVITEMGEHNAKLYNELKQLKQDYKILHTASDEVLKTIVWLCEHEPDNILIPQGLQAMCGCLQQVLAKEK